MRAWNGVVSHIVCVTDTLQITRPRRTKHPRRLRRGHRNKDSRYVPFGDTRYRSRAESTSARIVGKETVSADDRRANGSVPKCIRLP